MKELTMNEVEQINGGWVNVFLPVAVSVGSRFLSSQLAKHALSSGSLAYGTFRAAVGAHEKVFEMP
ncbi:hypothetical protein [uncultured Microbulbifer sp.]|uniref:hypothetical protein n=1 Tax=uncultured Microbulbifer sp. TaxID=348147 RepID=UPI00262A2CA6|nr:hypothetical protein [uncultured Microbulbifer sp.]